MSLLIRRAFMMKKKKEPKLVDINIVLSSSKTGFTTAPAGVNISANGGHGSYSENAQLTLREGDPIDCVVTKTTYSGYDPGTCYIYVNGMTVLQRTAAGTSHYEYRVPPNVTKVNIKLSWAIKTRKVTTTFTQKTYYYGAGRISITEE